MKKNKVQKTDTVEMIGKCIMCGKKQVLTAQQILDAEKYGLTSTCCFFPMTLEKIKVKFAK